MTVGFRLDVSATIGSGHFMRCLSLAQVLRTRGAQVFFVCRLHADTDKTFVEAAGFPVFWLPDNAGLPVDNDVPHAVWRGGTQKGDAGEFLEVLRVELQGLPCDWVVVDHYGLSRTWEQKVRAHTKSILVIDDLADREHDADVLLDANAYVDREHRYTSLLPASCETRLGGEHALLRPEFENATPLTEDSSVPVIHVALGGSDQGNLTAKVLRALNDLNVKFDVVVGGLNPHVACLENLAAANPGISLHINTSRMAHLLSRATIAVGSAGTSTWERMAVGVPSVLYSTADNQDAIGRDTMLQGGSVFMGTADEFCPVRLSKIVKELLESPDRRALMRSVGFRLVRPGGVHRLANRLTGTKLRVSIASDAGSWMSKYIAPFVLYLEKMQIEVCWVHHASDIKAGDICFLLSFGQLVPAAVRARNTHTLVVHGSDLPEGRGWSPMTWEILEGRSRFPVTLIAAEEKVDSGAMYDQEWFELAGNELVDDWRRIQSGAVIRLCKRFVERFPQEVTIPREQVGQPTYYKKRGPEDSRLDPQQNFVEQFNLLRVCDNNRYPAFFELNGDRYIVKIESDTRDMRPE